MGTYVGLFKKRQHLKCVQSSHDLIHFIGTFICYRYLLFFTFMLLIITNAICRKFSHIQWKWQKWCNFNIWRWYTRVRPIRDWHKVAGSPDEAASTVDVWVAKTCTMTDAYIIYIIPTHPYGYPHPSSQMGPSRARSDPRDNNISQPHILKSSLGLLFK